MWHDVHGATAMGSPSSNKDLLVSALDYLNINKMSGGKKLVMVLVNLHPSELFKKYKKCPLCAFPNFRGAPWFQERTLCQSPLGTLAWENTVMRVHGDWVATLPTCFLSVGEHKVLLSLSPFCITRQSRRRERHFPAGGWRSCDVNAQSTDGWWLQGAHRWMVPSRAFLSPFPA